VSGGRYRLSQSGRVSDQLRAVFARGAAEGASRVTAQAAKWMIEELERTPAEFGESRDFLAHAELQSRIAFVPPIYVRFAIHEPTRTVFVGRIGWTKRG
jgi:hypothetical protein